MRKYLFLLLTLGLASTTWGVENSSNQADPNFGYIAKLKGDGTIDFIGNKNSILSNWNFNLHQSSQKLTVVDIIQEGGKYFLVASGQVVEMNEAQEEVSYSLMSVMELVKKDTFFYVTATVCTLASKDGTSKVRPRGNECVVLESELSLDQPKKHKTKDVSITGIEINYKIMREYYRLNKIEFE